MASANPNPSGPGAGAGPDIYQSGPANSNQFIRKFSLTLLGAGGQSWTLSDSSASGAQSGGTAGPLDDPLRISFVVRCPRVSSRQSMVCKVYNLSRQHPAAGIGALYNRAVLRAGYVGGQFGVIFDGQIINLRQGRESSLTETYLEINAQGSDFSSNLATVGLSVPAGGTVAQTVGQIASSMEAYGATLGATAGLSTVPLIRGRAHFGMAIDAMLKYGQTYVQNGVITVVRGAQAAGAGGGPITVNANTGLIGMVEITGPNGAEFDVNLNPTMQVGSVVQLNNADVNLIAAGNLTSNGLPQTQGPGNTQLGYYVDPSADGTYLAVLLEHHGDSRGNEWRTHVTAWPHGAAATPATDQSILPLVGKQPTPGQVSTAVAPPNLPTDTDAGYYQESPGAVF